MREPPNYFWATLFSWVLTGSGAALACAGTLAFFLEAEAPQLRAICVAAFAVMVSAAVACANTSAAAAMHALSNGRRHWAMFWAAIILTAGFCGVTGLGVDLGWLLMTDQLTHRALPEHRFVVAAAAFVAISKPGTAWLIEGRRALDRTDAEHRSAAEEAALEAARQRDREAALSAPNVRRFKPRSAAGGAMALGFAAAIGPPHEATAAPPQVQLDEPAPPHSEAPARRRAKKQRGGGDRAEAARLLQEGRLSNRAIAALTGLSRSTIDRLAKMMLPPGARRAGASL